MSLVAAADAGTNSRRAGVLSSQLAPCQSELVPIWRRSGREAGVSAKRAAAALFNRLHSAMDFFPLGSPESCISSRLRSGFHMKSSDSGQCQGSSADEGATENPEADFHGPLHALTVPLFAPPRNLNARSVGSPTQERRN